MQPVAVSDILRGKAIVSRRCPECGHRDIVVAHERAIALWLGREAGIRRLLGEVANRLAEHARAGDGAG